MLAVKDRSSAIADITDWGIYIRCALNAAVEFLERGARNQTFATSVAGTMETFMPHRPGFQVSSVRLWVYPSEKMQWEEP